MDLDRGALAKIDRKVLSGLGHDERYQMVRVPVSKAVWTTWKRYCEAVELPMGRSIVALIHHELRSVVDNLDGGSVFLAQLERAAAERQAALHVRERHLSAQEERLRGGVDPVGFTSRVGESTLGLVRVVLHRMGSQQRPQEAGPCLSDLALPSTRRRHRESHVLEYSIIDDLNGETPMLQPIRRDEAQVDNIPGRDWLLYVESETTAVKNLTLGWVTFQAVAAFPGHVHPTHVTPKGTMTLESGTTTYIPVGLHLATVSHGSGPSEMVTSFSPPVVPGSRTKDDD